MKVLYLLHINIGSSNVISYLALGIIRGNNGVVLVSFYLSNLQKRLKVIK